MAAESQGDGSHWHHQQTLQDPTHMLLGDLWRRFIPITSKAVLVEHGDQRAVSIPRVYLCMYCQGEWLSEEEMCVYRCNRMRGRKACQKYHLFPLLHLQKKNQYCASKDPIGNATP